MSITIRTVESIATLEGRLRRKGWRRGGQGAYGYVMLKGDLCWKITDFGDRGYRSYLAQIAAGRFSGPHVPRIKLVLKDREGRVAVLMERLKGTLYELFDDHFLESTVKSALLRRNHFFGWRHLRTYCANYRVPSSFLLLGKRLKAHAVRARRNLDIHSGNIMLRRDGTLVVTDPMC